MDGYLLSIQRAFSAMSMISTAISSFPIAFWFNPFYRIDRVFWTAINKFKLVKLAASKQQGLTRIEESLHAVDLRPEEVLNRYPHQLSGGQRQRVMLARVHLFQPKFIIAHEFTYALYPHVGNHIIGKVLQAGYELNIPLCVVAGQPNSDVVVPGAAFARVDAENVTLSFSLISYRQ